MKKQSLKLDELGSLAREIAEDFDNGVVILRGNLAAGKTTFVKVFAKELGYLKEVTSPTFSLQQCYGEKIFHYDIYNHGLDHFIALGMLEELEKEGIHFIEWGDDTLRDFLVNAGIKTVTIDIEKTENDTREYTVCTH